MAKGGDDERPIIIKKVIKKGGGHHGGAWKVAYADFVTAMMAFFLLLWLLNITTKEQKEGIAEYFDPHPRVTESQSGAGGVLGGLTVAPEGAMTSSVQPITTPNRPQNPALRPGSEPKPSNDEDVSKQKIEEHMRQIEQERFEEAKKQIQQALQESPELKDVMKNIMMDITPEGLRIQIVDQDGASMFPSGSAQMYEKTKELHKKIAEIVKKLPNQISVRGHTDSIPYGSGTNYTNWNLSADRANASREALIESGFPEKRINNVMGKADTEPLIKDNPKDARNRRISIILLREELTRPAESSGAGADGTGSQTTVPVPAPAPMPYNKSEGSVYFP